MSDETKGYQPGIDQLHQVQLWDDQHARRFSEGMESDILRHTPSESAVIFGDRLGCIPGHVLEVGSAHGRDARYWASLGHRVYCADFSQVALTQLVDLAHEQGVQDNVCPRLHDISTGELPDTEGNRIQGFYARSALHVSDPVMMSVAAGVNARLDTNGLILIEGKGILDHKIKRGITVANNLVIDPYENAHLRRVWTEEFMRKMCEEMGWCIEDLTERDEPYENNPISFIRLIAKKQ